MRIPVITLFFTFLLFSTQAQDKIYRKGGSVLLVKVEEVGVADIKYKEYNNLSGPSYAIEKDRIVKIVFENGRTESYKASLKDPELYVGQAGNAIKLNFLSPLFGYTLFGFERSIKPGRSWEASLGFIGLGKNQVIDYSYWDPYSQPDEYKRDAKGICVGFGYKFIRTPDFINRDIRYAHLLQGTYIKPMMYTGYYNENVLDNKTGSVVVDTRDVYYGSIMLELGKQWIFSDQFMFDLYGGIGYCFDNIKDNGDYTYSISDESSAHHFTNVRLGQSPGFALSGGIRIGMLLRGKKE
jgi:hypothetical protein